jgi:hypothetical protein
MDFKSEFVNKMLSAYSTGVVTVRLELSCVME